MSDLWISSRSRREPLTDHETVRLGRVLAEASAEGGVYYPDAPPTATAVVRAFTGQLSAKALERVAEVLGKVEFSERQAP